MLRGQSIKEAMYGVRCWCQHQSFLLLVDGAGQRHLRVIMNRMDICLPDTGQSSFDLIPCKCKKGCIKQCKCKRPALDCTAPCYCEEVY